jgi:hypothetical protein
MKTIEAEGGPSPITHYRGWLNIAGDAPINLNTLDPNLYPEPEPEPEPVPPPLPPRKPGVNYSGFFGGVIHCPTGEAGSVGIDNYLVKSVNGPASFAVFPFFLPFKTVVSSVSIFVVVPHLGNSVVVELRDANGKRVCSATMDVSKDGVAAGAFDTVNLSAGEYVLAWATKSPSGNLRVRSVVATHAVQLALANARVPIMAYFKA